MRRVVGGLLWIPSVFLLLAAVPWLAWILWIAWEGRGADRGLALLLGPSTCVGLVPVGLAAGVGLWLWRGERADEG